MAFAQFFFIKTAQTCDIVPLLQHEIALNLSTEKKILSDFSNEEQPVISF